MMWSEIPRVKVNLRERETTVCTWAVITWHVLNDVPFCTQFIHLNTSTTKKKVCTCIGVLISKLVIVQWHDTDMEFVEFSHLHFDTSFSSRDYNHVWHTDLWEMVQIQKLQMKKYHAGIIRENNMPWTLQLNDPHWLTRHCAVVNKVEWHAITWTEQ